MHKIEDIKKSTLDYFNGDELAADVWIKKYSLKDSKGNIFELNPKEMHKRLAKEFARIEKKYPHPMSEKLIFNLLDRFKYIVPQGSPMSGIGNNYQTVSISNCFVVGNEGDSYGGILRLDEEQVQLMKRRGGVGIDLSHIRPNGSPVQNAALTSTGIVPFMERFSNTTREVAQGGRRGALMLSISIKHPDSENFIDAKLELDKVTGANISVKIDDEFMKAVKEDGDYFQTFPSNVTLLSDYSNFDYNKVYTGEGGMTIKKVKARRLWNKIVKNGWTSAEPGILFWDTVLRESNARPYGKDWEEKSTNPCGEIPLNPNDSCRLLAINLFSYVENPFTDKATFNFNLFKQHVGYAQKMSDDIVDLELEKIDKILAKIESDDEPESLKQVERDLWKKIKKTAREGRRTGTGITGEGDMLAALGLRYGSDDAIEFSEKVHKTMALAAYSTSVVMAMDRGAFPIHDSKMDKESAFLNRLLKEDSALEEGMKNYGRRNIALLTIAPTGTTSLMTQTTSGIEPVFMPVYRRRRKILPGETDVETVFTDDVGDKWTEYNVFHHKFKDWFSVYEQQTVQLMRDGGYDIDFSPTNLELLDEEKVQKYVEISPYYKATSNDVDWIAKVKMQGIVQKWVDHSISVTVNLPKETKEELIGEIYEAAYDAGCKGVTVYRDGSRTGVLVTTETKKEEIFKRPKELSCHIYHVQANKQKYYVLVGLLNGKPYEVFALRKKAISIPQIRKDGILVRIKSGVYNLRYNGTEIENITQHFEYPEEDGFTRLLSLLLKSDITIENVVDQVNKSQSFIGGFYKAITRVLANNYIEDRELDEPCPNCGAKLQMVEGCVKCTCGEYSKCG